MSLPQHTQDVLTAGEISSDRQTLKMNDFLKQIEAYSNDKLDKFMPQMNQAQHLTNIIGSSSSMGHNTGNNGSVISNYNILNQQAKIAEQVKNMIDQEMQAAQNQQMRSSAKRRYQRDEQREDQDEDDIDEDSLPPEDTPVTSGEPLNTPDYEHLLSVISDGFNKLIGTFYSNSASAVIGASLARVKESYEEIINSIVENLSQQID